MIEYKGESKKLFASPFFKKKTDIELSLQYMEIIETDKMIEDER